MTTRILLYLIIAALVISMTRQNRIYCEAMSRAAIAAVEKDTSADIIAIEGCHETGQVFTFRNPCEIPNGDVVDFVYFDSEPSARRWVEEACR